MPRKREYPILEFDPTREAVIEPSQQVLAIDIPEHAVACFFKGVVDGLCRDGRARMVSCQKSEMGEHPVYEIDFKGKRLAVFHPGLCAPFVVAMTEEVIALGCRKFIACGGAGVLVPGIPDGHVIVPESAIRDEGTSFHYLPPGREVHASPEAVAAIKTVLERRGVPYTVGKTWTTDGIYRETPGKVALRRKEGCLTVEMEAAAFFALAEFRGVSFGQILYAGDDLSGPEWNPRSWDRKPVREELFWLAAEACLEIATPEPPKENPGTGFSLGPG